MKNTLCKLNVALWGFVFATLHQALFAQSDTSFNAQFTKVLTAFPGRFSSIKGAPQGLNGASQYSKICFRGVKYCLVEKNSETNRDEFVSTIESKESLDAAAYEKLLEAWKAKISAFTFNGVPMVRYTSDKYSKDDDDMYWKGEAWRLSTHGFSIDKQYLACTIRLELLDLEQGGLMLRLLVTDN